MATSRSFAYNTGSPISGTEQVGNLAVSVDLLDYTISPGGVQWWQGPDQDLGYVIAHTVPNDTQPTPVADYLYLDPSRLGNSAGLSNNNQTVIQQFGYIQSTLGTKLIGANDIVMFSVLVSLGQPETLPDSHFIGIGTANMNYNGVTPDLYSAYPGNDDKSMGYRSNGTIWYNGSEYASGLQSWGDDDIIDIVINNNVGGMWVRVNGGNWNNNATHNPETNVGGIEVINAPFYPALCPGYVAGMTIQNSAAYGTPRNCKLLGDETAAVGFNRSTLLTESSFIEVANSVSGQVFISGNAASTWLTDNGYWNSWTSFGSSGFQWMTINSVTSTTATGIGQNSITISITQSGGGMEITNGMYNPTTFPEEYGVPFDGNQILNQNSGIFTATFSEPVTDALVGFASIGNPSTQVPIIVSAPFTPIWSTATTFQNPVGVTQYTQLTGTEGFCIIRIDGTVSSVTFNYTASEYYCNVCFGFVDQNA
jgi:hypothetical protein